MEQSLVVLSLEVTPRLLAAMTADCTSALAWTPRGPGEWSIALVVRHLMEGDRDTFLPRLRRMVAEERPVFDKKGGAYTEGRDLPAMVAVFETARGEAVRTLKSLDAEAWRREGVSPSRGSLTIAEYARTMAEHDIEHLRQIHEVRETLGLMPKRAEAKLALPLTEIARAITAGPERVRELADGLTDGQLRHRPRDGQWSMKETMAHLLKVERDVFLPRLGLMASEHRPVFERFDPDAWAAERDHREGDFAEEWRQFSALRDETVALVRSLSPAAAGRLGLSSFFGPITLAQYATHVVDHDIEHLAQLSACRAAALTAR